MSTWRGTGSTTPPTRYSTVQYSTVQYREHHTTNKVGARQAAGCRNRDSSGWRPARLAGHPRRGHCGAAVRGVRPGAGAGDPGGGAPRPPAPGLRQDPLPLLLPAAGMLDPARQVTQLPAMQVSPSLLTGLLQLGVSPSPDPGPRRHTHTSPSCRQWRGCRGRGLAGRRGRLGGGGRER